MAQLLVNNAATTLAVAALAGDATLTVVDGSHFPTPTAGDFFLVTLSNATPETLWEICKCTSRSGNVLTITRAQEGTTALGWAIGSKCEVRLTAGAHLPSSKVDFTQSGASSVERSVEAKLQEVISVKDKGAIGDGVVDDTASIAAAYSASKWLILPSGTYKVSSLPNFGVAGTRILGVGKVTINYTGTGQGLTVDAGAYPAAGVNDVLIDNITINGNASATDGVFIRGIGHSSFKNLRVKNFPTSAMRTNFMVSNVFENFVCSGNEGAFTTTPASGIILDKRNAGEQSSNCTFVNTIIEGVTGVGIDVVEGVENTFIGGTSEGNGTGVVVGANSIDNTFISLDMEANTTSDVDCSGLRNTFINLLSTNTIRVLAGNTNSFVGGSIHNLTISGGVTLTKMESLGYTGTITDGGTSTLRVGCYNVTGAVLDADTYPRVVESTWVVSATNLTVVGTPTYTGTYKQIGKTIYFTIRVQSTTSTAATAGSTWFSLPTSATGFGCAAAANDNTSVGYGVGHIVNAQVFVPTWSANSDVVVSGFYFVP